MGPKKKGKKHEEDDWESEVINELEQLKIAEAAPEPEPAGKKGKGKKGKKTKDDDDWENEAAELAEAKSPEPAAAPAEPAGKKAKGKKGKKGKDGDDWENDDIPEPVIPKASEPAAEAEPAGKKGKGKKGKKAKDDDDDWEKEANAFAALEADQAESEPEPEPEPVSKKGKKKGKKAVDSDDDWEAEALRESEPTPEPEPEPAGKKGKKKQPAKGGKAAAMQEEDLDALLQELGGAPAAAAEPAPAPAAKDADDSDDEGDAAGGTVKSKAQKRAEKKKKQQQQKKQGGGAATKKDEEDEGSEPEAEQPAPAATPAAAKEDKKAAGKKKGPSGMLKALQEQQKRMQEEEERRKREAEEAERLEQERLRQLEEEEKREAERKELAKQKKAEKLKRLKEEGKLLTKAQKEAKAKAEAFKQHALAQGLVPAAGAEGEEAAKPKRVVYDNKKKKKGPADKKDEAQKPATPAAAPAAQAAPTTSKQPAAESVEEADEVSEDWEAAAKDHAEGEEVKDAWDASSEGEEDEEEEEEEEEEEKPAPAPAKAAPPAAKAAKKPAKPVESESESDSDDSSDDSSEDERGGNRKKVVVDKDVVRRIKEREAAAEQQKDLTKLRSPICCVLGHVDTGKTKILDHIRRTNVQTGEAGGITQQIGATYVPAQTIEERTAHVNPSGKKINVPGLLVIDTPGHESFSNLRSRGSSLCDIAILVVDIMHGLEPQTIESLNLLKEKKTPFVVALNKIDRLYDWQPHKDSGFMKTFKAQKGYVQTEFKDRCNQVVLQFAEQGLNSKPFYDFKDVKEFKQWVAMVPTSAHTGEGIPDLMMLLVQLTQNLMASRIAFVDKVQCTVLEVKVLPGLGTTIDVILTQGALREGDTIVVSGMTGPIVTQIRGLLMPEPLKELRVKNQYRQHKEIAAAQGVKVLAKNLEEAVAGTQLYVAKGEDEVEYYRKVVKRDLEQALASLRTDERGVSAQASTLGALEALLSFLRDMKIPVATVNIGPVHKRDVMKCSTQLSHDPKYAMILAFDVKVDKDAEDLAKEMGVILFTADIIYHLFDRFTEHMERIKQQQKEEHKGDAWFPCHLRVKPEFMFNKRDPIVCGVDILEGRLVTGMPIVVPSKEFMKLGNIESIEVNNKEVKEAKVGQSVCIKITNTTGEAPRMFGRHFDENDDLYTDLKRKTIDVLKEYFREEMTKDDWRLIMRMKKIFGII